MPWPQRASAQTRWRVFVCLCDYACSYAFVCIARVCQCEFVCQLCLLRVVLSVLCLRAVACASWCMRCTQVQHASVRQPCHAPPAGCSQAALLHTWYAVGVCCWCMWLVYVGGCVVQPGMLVKHPALGHLRVHLDTCACLVYQAHRHRYQAHRHTYQTHRHTYKAHRHT